MSQFKRLSIQNRVAKRGRNEPPPDLSKLQFGDAAPRRRQSEQFSPTTPGQREPTPLFMSPEAENTQQTEQPYDYIDPAQHSRSPPYAQDTTNRFDCENTQYPVSNAERSTSHLEASAAPQHDGEIVYPDPRHSMPTVPPLLGPQDDIRPGVDDGKTNKNDVIGTLSMGNPLKQLGEVKFRGLLWPVQRQLYRLQNERNLQVTLATLCPPDYYRDFCFPMEQNFSGSGYIQGFPPFPKAGKPGSIKEVQKLHAQLVELASGAWFHTDTLSMIVFPNHSTDWEFLSVRIRPVPATALVRFVIQDPLPEDFRSEVNNAQHVGPTDSLPQAMSDPPLHPPVNPTSLPLTPTNPHAQLSIEDQDEMQPTMLEKYGIEYKTLVNHIRDRDKIKAHSDTFFIIYPADKDKELRVVLDFLRGNNAKKIYIFRDTQGGHDLSRGDSDWSAFCGLLKDKYPGVILAHSSIFRWDCIPRFASLTPWLLNIFTIDLVGSPSLMSHPHLVRLFPFGSLILITNSLILLQPQEAVRILRWFRCIQLSVKPTGTWKLVTRPCIKDYILSAAEARTDEKEKKELMSVYQEFWYLLHDHETLCPLTNTWIPKHTAPLFSLISDPSPSNFSPQLGSTEPSRPAIDLPTLAKNDDFLSEYFAGFCLSQAENFRKFNIVAAGDAEPQKAQRMQWRAKWQHVTVSRASEYIRHSGIEDEEKLGKAAESWLRKWEEGMGKKIEGVENGGGIVAVRKAVQGGGAGEVYGKGKEGKDWDKDFQWWRKGRRDSGLDPRGR